MAEKQCEYHCPECDSENIDWQAKDIQDNTIYQNLICKDCGCEFSEN